MDTPIPDEMEYATIDNDVATSSEASIVEIVLEIMQSSAIKINDEERDDELEIQPVTQAEALKSLEHS